MHLKKTFGSLNVVHEAASAVLKLKPSEFVEWRMQFTDSIFDKLFVLQTLALDNMNRATYVAGKKVYDQSREQEFMYVSELNK